MEPVVLMVGNGQLAAAIRKRCEHENVRVVEGLPSAGPIASPERIVVIHAGSGRELEGAVAFSTRAVTPLIQASTGLDDCLPREPAFPLIIAPNLAIPVIRALAALAGWHRDGLELESLWESHQAEKTSVAGTALAIADEFEFPHEEIMSERRDPARHAYHHIALAGTNMNITLDLKVKGLAPYAEGALMFARALVRHRATLQHRIYRGAELLALL